MHQNHLHTGIEFTRAVAKHFKLPDTTDADMELITGANEVFGVKVKLALTADDLVGIAQHMGATGKTAGLEPTSSLVKMTMADGDVLVLTVPSIVILAWQGLLGIEFDPWEARLLRRLLNEYVNESYLATKRDRPPPYGAPIVLKRVRAREADRNLDLFLA